MPTRRRGEIVPTDLRVVVRVRVNETGRDDEIGSVDRVRGRPVDFSDVDDDPVANTDVGVHAGRTGAVDDGSVSDQQVVGHR